MVADLHEFRITSSNETVLMILMKTVGADLSSIGGSRHGMVYSPFIQEVDIETGKLVWEWSAAEHLIVRCYFELQSTFSGSFQHFGGGVYGYAHCNAVYKDEDGNFLMSFRFYSMIIKVDGKTKDIIWRLGGKNSDFSFNNGSTFIGQHDPQVHTLTFSFQLTLFDNDCDDLGTLGPWGTARGIWVRLDYDKMTVTLVREYLPPERKRADIEGGMEILPNGNVLVAHGSSGWVLEYTHDGELVFNGQTHQVYRAYKYPKDFWPGNGLPDPIESNDYVDIDDDVSMVFDSGHGQCEGLLSFLGLCLST
ncbi:hypothetical protein FISHEDRAFT_38264 [Fistulina hepatica ATCC 64428]|nr:hypothetical protein FISHEDRAFT_38264 [Fistulina hepatica ATCC 64428]